MHIPDPVKRQLRAEVGFGCPVEDCGSPYLTYHHFDPPRKVRPHNEPGGMIALCRKHHDDAEGGGFTDDQLRELKLTGAERNQRISGSFSWRRQQLMVHIGGILTFETSVPLAFNGVPVVSLTRDDRGDLLVSINMLTSSVLPRLRMFENDWVSVGNVTDLESPPYARILRASYPNRDSISIEFKTVADADELATALPNMERARQWAVDLAAEEQEPLRFPAVLVDIELTLPDAEVFITKQGVKTPASQVSGSYGAQAPCALSLGHIRYPFSTMHNSIAIAPERPLLRFASMNDQEPWNISDRTFRHMTFLLDGSEFQNCTFEECWFAWRGQYFGLNGNDLGNMSMLSSQEVQLTYNMLKSLAEGGLPQFIDVAEHLGAAGARGRAKQQEIKQSQQGAMEQDRNQR